jgi:transposase-like protein
MTKSFGQRERDELVGAVKRGEPVAAAARRFGVTPVTAYTWIRKSGEAGSRETAVQPTFLELVTSGITGAGLVVRVGDAEIEVRPGFDVALLRAVVAALRGTP